MKFISVISLLLLAACSSAPKPAPMVPDPEPAKKAKADDGKITEDDLKEFGMECIVSCSARIPSVKFCGCMCDVTVSKLRTLHIKEDDLADNLEKVMPNDKEMTQCEEFAGKFRQKDTEL